MKRIEKINNRQKTLVGNMVGVAMVMITLALGAGLLSWGLLREALVEKNAHWMLYILLSFAVLLGTNVANLQTKDRKIHNVGIQSVLVILILLAIHIVFVNEPFENIGLSIASVIIGGAFSILNEFRPHNKRKRIRNR